MIDANTEIKKGVLSEQFIPDNVFVYVSKGTIHCYDGNKDYIFKTGEYFIARKNRLARYKIEKSEDEFKPITFCFDEHFARDFQQKHRNKVAEFKSADSFVKIKPTRLIPNFIRSLKPYYDSLGKLNDEFEEVKFAELLIVLLQNQPQLAGIFFDYAIPGKINLEEFMNRNFSFNVCVSRFAFLTGRSLSAFKRDFKAIFNETPNRWLVQKRLQEAYFLMDKKSEKPVNIYLDLGFETLSHFSFAFKRKFGHAPTELTNKKKNCT